MSGSPYNANWRAPLPGARLRFFDLGPTSRLASLVSWLRAQAKLSEQQRREQALAGARLALAISCLLTAHLQPVSSGVYATLAQTVFLAYGLHSLLLLVLLKFGRLRDPALRFAVHLADIVSATLMFWLLAGSEAGLLLQESAFVFVLLTAAYRWGLQPTLATAGASVGLLIVQEVSWLLIRGEAHLGRVIVQALPLLAVAYLIGYLGEKEIHLRTKASLISQVVANARSEAGLRETLHAVMVAMLDLFKSDRALLALRETGGRTFLWEIRSTGATPSNPIRLSELESFQYTRYFFPAPATTFHATKVSSSKDAKRYRVVVHDAASEQPVGVWSFPDYFLAWHRFTSLLTTSFKLEEWDGRLFLFEPGLVGETELRFLEDLVQELAPAVYSVYRLRRLRSRAGSLERARMARELHDTVVQTLIGVDMQLAVLRSHHTRRDQERTAQELARLQSLLRQEILNVRDLIQRIKRTDLDGNRLLDSLSFIADRFGRETGISTRFVSDFQKAALPLLPAREVGRILQEALVNVRKHSEAKNVLVRLSAVRDLWKLTIEDDGCGFDFSGQRSHAELDTTCSGPAVIKERVRSIGGELTVESVPGHGSRLEITVPHQVHDRERATTSYSNR